MLLTLESEISAYLPTSKWKDTTRLLSVIDEEEENGLVPLLGRDLFDYLCERYEELILEHGGITPDVIERDAVDDTVRLLRVCQKIVLYLALGNNSGILGVSLNPGGGMNVVSSEYYENADKDSIARFERDTWKKAHRNMDILLSMLERDAQSKNPQFATYWESSSYYYLKRGLLFSTAMQMQDYLDIKSSRERYIELVPDIKYCQGVYIAPQLGDELLQAFIKKSVSTPGNQWDEVSVDEENRILKDWAEAADRIRTALAGYVEYRNVKMRRSDSLSEADMSMARAIQYISSHQESFEPYVANSPFYIEPTKAEIKEGKHGTACPGHVFDPCDPDNMITVLQPTLRRW